MTYRAPVADIAFTLRHSAGFSPALREGLFGELAEDDVEAVLAQAGKFSTDVIAPLNAVGDRHGPASRRGVDHIAPMAFVVLRKRNAVDGVGPIALGADERDGLRVS
jgi:hypothetical protein